MKKIKGLLAVLLLLALAAALGSCYVISGQKMSKVKGTYKLTHYTYTGKYERKEGYTPTTVNYIEDEAYQYEDYLVVTGSGIGYYVHKDANTAAYSKEVTLSYQYEEDSSSVEYVIFNDALSVDADMGMNKLGVTKDHLNYSKQAFDYTELISKKKMRSEDISVRWEKVSKATDLSYVEKQLGQIKKYDYDSFGVRGIYELGNGIDSATGAVLGNGYQYFYYVIDPATDATTATVHYALEESPTTPVTATVTISHISGDWSSMTIDGVTWTIDPLWGVHYYNEIDGVRREINCVSNDIANETLQSLIQRRLPALQN